jgi:tetratricopeptide (TPR) repeat protein
LRLDMRVLAVALVSLVLVAASSGAAYIFYARTSPRLATEVPTARAKRVKEMSELDNRRAAVTAVREFLLDYPASQDPELRLNLLAAIADQPDADFASVADDFERAALGILTIDGPKRLAHLMVRGFARVMVGGYARATGYVTYQRQHYDRWLDAPMVLADIDGDGRSDALCDFSPGACCLFRHTQQGWVAHRLTTSGEIRGMWVFDITPHGPRVIELATQTRSEYDPTFLVDVYVWRNNRIENVLSTTLPHGFQMDHRDLDGSGRQAIRLYSDMIGSAYTPNPHTLTVYRWDGRRYRLDNTRQLATSQIASEWQEEGEALFERGRYADAERAYTAALAWKPATGTVESADYRFRKNLVAWHLGLSRALRGDRAGSLAAMQQVTQSQDETDYDTQAGKFIAALTQNQTLPQAFAAAGQVFRALESAVHAARQDATPAAIFTAAGIQPDRLQQVDLSADGVSSDLTQLSWPDGSAVVALRPDRAGKAWQLHILACAHTVKPVSGDGNTPQSSFYLSQAPALQLYPAATEVRLAGVRAGDGHLAPEIDLSYRQNGSLHTGIVRWNGERFTVVSPRPPQSESFTMELNRIEGELFVERSYQKTLATLEALAARIRTSDLNPLTRTALLQEILYFEALCYRKLGQTHRAAVIYAALYRTDPYSDWGHLAQSWLAQPGTNTAPSN